MISTSKYFSPKEAALYVKRQDLEFEFQLTSLVNKIMNSPAFCADKPLKAITLSGPTCAGKTTASKLINRAFAQKGVSIKPISLDDFYLNRDYLLSRSENGEIDFDSPETLDWSLVRKVVIDIFIGEKEFVRIPVFDFESGTRTGFRELQVCPNDIFLFEGIQAIYKEMLTLLSPFQYVSVFINAEKAISAGDICFPAHKLRLMRRLVRDYHKRGTDPHYTIKLWKSVRANEDKYIIPFAAMADYHIDSTMGYDIGMLKEYLMELLPMFKAGDAFYEESRELLGVLEKFTQLDKSLLEPDSLYHEFV